LPAGIFLIFLPQISRRKGNTCAPKKMNSFPVFRNHAGREDLPQDAAGANVRMLNWYGQQVPLINQHYEDDAERRFHHGVLRNSKDAREAEISASS